MSTFTNLIMTNGSKLASYPPLFRQRQSVEHLHSTVKESDFDSDWDSDSDSIPVIDFHQLTPKVIGQACRDWGMFRLVNHEIPLTLLPNLHNYANQLFALSFESKQAMENTPLIYFWGSPALSMSGNASKTTPTMHNNLKWLEGFHAPLSSISRLQCDDPLLESFRSLLEEYGSHQTRVATAIFSAITEDLSILPTKSSLYLSPATAFLRVYRYLRRPTAEQRWGINAHTDSSVLTILHQDQVGGLQIYKKKKWLNVKPVRDSLIVNIGDMMQGMSNDEYISVKHRVKLNWKQERISVGYFVFPADDAIIESSNYRPFTYADFQAQTESDLETLGFKIGLSRFRIT